METKAIPPVTLIQIVCDYLGVDPEKVVSKSRKRELVIARQICIYLMVLKLKKTRKVAALIMGGRDHTTAIHSINTVRDLLDTDPAFKTKLENVENLLPC